MATNASLFERAQRVIPDRFFWALPPGEEDGEPGAEGAPDEGTAPRSQRNVH